MFLRQGVRGQYQSLFLVLVTSQAMVHEAVEHDVPTAVTTDPPRPKGPWDASVGDDHRETATRWWVRPWCDAL